MTWRMSEGRARGSWAGGIEVSFLHRTRRSGGMGVDMVSGFAEREKREVKRFKAKPL